MRDVIVLIEETKNFCAPGLLALGDPKIRKWREGRGKGV